jgi:hypothetical protein
MMAQGDGARPMSAAQSWRIAVQIWLQRHGVIGIARGKSGTRFSEEIGS